MQRHVQPKPAERPAFTLVEILVVLGLIAVLVALTAGTVMQVLRSRVKTNTEQEVRNIFEPLDLHLRAVIDLADKELPIPQSVMAIAGNDPKRAKVIWRKLQIKRNFPMTFAEALSPATVTGNTVLPAPVGSLLYQLSLERDMQPHTVFTTALTGSSAPINASYVFGNNPQAEMGVLLRLTLTINRRGTKPFNAEEVLGPQAVVDTTADQPAGFNIGIPQIVDGWGKPLAFFRFPTDNLDMDNAKPGNPTLDPRRDPQDPEGRLLDQGTPVGTGWNSQAQYSAQGGIYWFELLCHRVHDPTQAVWTPQAVFMLPTIVSDGPNKRLGIVLGPSAPFSAVTSNFGMFIDQMDIPGYQDDIFSYSVR